MCSISILTIYIDFQLKRGIPSLAIWGQYVLTLASSLSLILNILTTSSLNTMLELLRVYSSHKILSYMKGTQFSKTTKRGREHCQHGLESFYIWLGRYEHSKGWGVPTWKYFAHKRSLCMKNICTKRIRLKRRMICDCLVFKFLNI